MNTALKDTLVSHNGIEIIIMGQIGTGFWVSIVFLHATYSDSTTDTIKVSIIGRPAVIGTIFANAITTSTTGFAGRDQSTPSACGATLQSIAANSLSGCAE